MGEILSSLLSLLLNPIISFFKTDTIVLVHEAYLISNNDKPCYFIKIINRSKTNDNTITHIWIKDSPREKDLLQKPLPHKLKPSEIFETWIEKKLINDQINIFKNVRVELSDGKIFKSKKNKNVRPIGYIA
jgi:hypothetical protein